MHEHLLHKWEECTVRQQIGRGHGQRNHRTRDYKKAVPAKASILFADAVKRQRCKIHDARRQKNRLLIQKNQSQHKAGPKNFGVPLLACVRLLKADNAIQKQNRKKSNRLVIVAQQVIDRRRAEHDRKQTRHKCADHIDIARDQPEQQRKNSSALQQPPEAIQQEAPKRELPQHCIDQQIQRGQIIVEVPVRHLAVPDQLHIINVPPFTDGERIVRINC